MSLFDAIKGELLKSAAGALSGGGTTSGGAPARGDLTSVFIDQIIDLVKNQGVGSIVDQFKTKGLGDVAQSWVGTGPNQPVSGEQVEEALNPGFLTTIAEKLGIDPKLAATVLSTALPFIIDRLTPSGTIPDPDA